MKNYFYFFSFVLTLAFSQLYSQTVSTIVPGQSSFDDCLTIDENGVIYASRYIGSTITKITTDGQTSIFASGISTPNGTDFGPDGFLYVPSNIFNGKIYKISPAGDVSVFIDSIQYPTTVLFRGDGMMYICSYQQNRVYLSDQNGNYSLLYTGNGMNGPVGMKEDSKGNLLIADYTDGKIFSVNSAGVFSLIAQVPGIVGFIEYANGYIYATGFSTNKIYKVTLGGQITVLAGTGSTGQLNGSAATATFNGPNGIVASKGGDSLYISDFYARSLRLITDVSVGVANISSVTPDGFNLRQNYPNPFNPNTIINYELQATSYELVSLKVFDVLGNQVAVLVNEKQNAGTYSVDFDGSNFSSGVYFYRLEVEGIIIDTKSMMLLK